VIDVYGIEGKQMETTKTVKFEALKLIKEVVIWLKTV
jgi:hypothetical protein